MQQQIDFGKSVSSISSASACNREKSEFSFSFSSSRVRMTFLAALLVFLLVSSGVEATDESTLSSPGSTCSLDRLEVTPCRCCKMDCWYTIAKGATHELGHIPGQEGEDEAMATLQLIRACMITQCASVCPAAAPPRLFRPMLNSASGNGNARADSQSSARSYPIAPLL